MELKVMVGSEMDMAGGMETGFNTDVGTDSKSAVDTSGNVGAVTGVVADMGAGTGLMMVGTDTGDDAGAVGEGQAGTIVGLVPSACVAVSGVLTPANAQFRIVMLETDMVVGSERDVVAEVHSGTSLEMVGVMGVAQGAGVGTKTVAVVCVETVVSVVHEWMRMCAIVL